MTASRQYSHFRQHDIPLFTTLLRSGNRTLTISLDTHLIQTIEKGAGVLLQTSLKRDGRLMPFDERELDLCDELESGFEVECPVKSGVETREREVTLDVDRVEGMEYVIVMDAWTRNLERITCLQGILKL